MGGWAFLAVYFIGGLYVEMTPLYNELADRALPFLCNDAKSVDIRLSLDSAEVEKRAKLYGFSIPLAEYQLSCEMFCKAVLSFDAFVLHASAVLSDGSVYLFSAPSGVGKSTHAAIWKRCFNAEIINDDKPLIRFINGTFTAYGTPWCGSGFERLNKSGKVKALFFIKRALENSVCRFDSEKALYLLLESMYRPADNSDMDSLITTLDAFLSKTRVLGLECNMKDEAARLALKTAKEIQQ